MYTISYIFGESTTIGYLLGTGDRLLITMQITVDDEGNDVTYFAEDKGLKLIKRGLTKLNYDYDEFFLVPAEQEFAIYDRDGELVNILYDGAIALKVQKEFYLKMEVKYFGQQNYITEFSGYAITDMLEYDPSMKTHHVTVMPKTNVLNETYLYPEGYQKDYWDPNNQTSSQPNNPLQLNFQKIGSAIVWNWISLKDLITKIFQLVNPNVSINFYHNWLFYGNSYWEYYVEYTKDDLKFDDIILDHNWVGSVFAYQVGNINSIGDLLKLLAFEFGSMAGMITQEKAFFKQILYWDNNQVESLGTLLESEPRKKYKFTKYDYVKITSEFYKQDAGQLNRYTVTGFSPVGYAPHGLFEKVSGKNGLDKNIISVADYKNQVLAGPWDVVSNLRAAVSGVPGIYYSIYGVKNPYIEFQTLLWNPPKSGYLGLAHYLAEYYYTLRGLLYRMPVYEFIVDGLNYNFMNGFEYDGYEFVKIGQEKDWDNEYTRIEALRLQSVQKEIENPAEGEIITIPVSTISMKVIPGQVTLSYEQVNQGAIAVAEMNADEWLDEFIIQVEVPFGENEISNFRIYDGSETLVTIDRIMGKFRQVINPQSIRKVKKYNAPDTIYLEWTPGTQNPTTGQGTLIIKKMVKA